MSDFVDERYRMKQGLRWWPETELVRFVGKTYKPVPFYETVKDLHALDLGCGTGRHVWFLNECGFTTFGLDNSEAAIVCARDYLSNRWIEPSPVTFMRYDLPTIPCQDASFDLVVDCQTIQHLSDDDHVKVYHEVVRVLRPSGRFWTMHWREGDSERLYGGQYPELRPWKADELGPLIQSAGLTHRHTRLVSCADLAEERNEVLSAHWYCMDWVKP